jgi:hypothetical protein
VGLGQDFVFPPGLIWARSSPAAHLDLMVARPFGSNKTSNSPSPPNPSTLSPLSFSLCHARGSEGHRCHSGRLMRYSSQGRESGRWCHLEPLVDVRAHRWVDASPLSGLMVVSHPARAPSKWWARSPSRSHTQRAHPQAA